MRRLAAAACPVLLSGAVLASGAAGARASVPAPGSVSFHVLGGFHLKRVETKDGKTSTALLLCSSNTFGNGAATIHGVGNMKDPTAACEQLNAVNGDLTKLNVHPAWMAPALVAQVHVEAHGTWKGVKIEYAHDFHNGGALAKQTGDVFAL
ncbi:hypothetical protein GCM10009839_87030 [Catenulispora yoronensis]|uniref:Subtilisin inhibitor domain-containing protein n=2 Tax=Catenulispora yoronensis TaxID=450799 RepID=A0ABN2VHB0_9ACTN